MLDQIHHDQDAEVLLNALLGELTDVGLVTWNGKGRITSLSEGCRKLMQLPASAAVGGPIAVLAQSPCRAIMPAYERFRETTEQPLLEQEFKLDRDGESYWLRLSIRRCPRGCGVNSAFLMIVRDVTLHNRSIERARYTQSFFEAALRAIPDAAVFTDTEGRLTKVSAGAERTFGYREAELLGQPINLLTEELQWRGDAMPHETDPTIAPVFQLVESKRKDGQAFSSEVTTDLIHDAAGKVVGSVAILRDVTERVELQEMLLQQTLLLDSIFRQLPFALSVVDTDRRIMQTSDAALALFGYRQEEMAKHSTRMIYPSDEEFARVGEAIYREDPGREVVAEMVDAAGRHFRGSIQVAPLRGPGPTLKGYLVAVEDVTERLVYEEELRRYEQMVSASSDALIFLDTSHVYRAANQAYLDLWGKRREEIIGEHISHVVGERFYLIHTRPALERCFAGESVFFSAIDVEYPSGRRFVDAQHTPYRNEQGEIVGVLVTVRDVTERHLAETAMQESEKKFRAIFDHAPVGMLMLDVADGAIIDVNPVVLQMHGYTREEFLALEPWDVVVGFTPQNFAAEWSKVTERHRSRFESEHWRKDGSRFHVLVDASRMRLKGQTVVISTLVDISQQKMLELRLREQQSQYQMLVESSNAILFAADPRTFRFNFVSQEAEHLLGYPVSDWLEKDDFWTDHLHPEDRNWAPDYCLSMVKRKLDHDFDYRMLTADGRVVWLHDATSVVLEEGDVISLVGVMVDITASKEAEAERRRLSEMVEQSADAILLTDTDFRITYINESFTRLYGYNLEDLRGKRPEFFSDEPDAASIYPEIYSELEAGRRVYRQLINRRKDGSNFHCQHSITPLRNDQGDVIAYMSSQRDVTLRMATEQALRESEEKYRQIVETAHEGIWVLDAEALTTVVNPRMAEMLGYAPEEMQGRALFDFTEESSRQLARQAWDRLQRDSKETVDLLYRRKDGTDLWCHVSTSALLDSRGEFNGAMALLTDITEERQLTEALIRSQKMEAVGQLTGGIAHDFNNILGSILGFAELAQVRFGGQDPKLHEYLTQIETAGGRARDLIRQLLIFSRGENTQAAASVPLSPLVNEVVKMLQPMLPATIEIRCQLSRDPLNVKVDPLHIQQLLMNLCINARDAIEESGLITVEVMSRKLEAGHCAICGESLSGEWAAIRVSDSGHGIAQALREDIFQPFITSKQVGEGSGMGLAVVRGIVKSYNGHLLVESSPGSGASFEILLPEASQESVVDESLMSVSLTAGSDVDLSGFTIMAVDDETQFRTYYEELLRDAGAQVVSCKSGIQALGRYQRGDHGFDLIICDQAMPGMSGMELVQHLRGLDCRVPVILCSGYGYEVDASKLQQLQITELLHKPVGQGELFASIRRGLSI